MRSALLFASMAIFLLSSCKRKNDHSLVPYKAKCVFEKEIKNFRWINLNRVFGDTLKLERENIQKNYLVEFNKTNNINTIIELGVGKTFSGKVTKYNGIYFLNSKTDNGYQITVIRNLGSIIQGIESRRTQLELLDKTISQGFHSELIKHEKDGLFILENDKKELSMVFSEILLNLPEWKVIKH
ncbi:MAG: hypothetical protein JXQ87_14080 [Bacteroidia bacterium]